MKRSVQTVLFDLDGTLVDSAPDLAGAANELRQEHGHPALPYESLRPMVGAGARGMVGLAFGVKPGDAGYEDLKARFLALYAQRLLRSTTVFEGVWPLLDRLEQHGLGWGIVTNKAYHLALAVSEGVGLHPRAGVLIGGDSTPFAKPHPEPLLEACRRLQADPTTCAYVGDDLRDIQAGRAAGMATLAAGWGYLGQGEPVHEWGADSLLEQPQGLLHWLNLP
ncbi:MAG: HAD family hydrolase [Betaproteobacteria bacterium]|jgi:phosphoglycolate phosphatase